MSSSVRIEDYYSDQDSPPPPPAPPITGRYGNSARSTGSNRSSPSSHYRPQQQRQQQQQAHSPMFRKRMYRPMPPRQYYPMSDNELTGSEGEDEEEEEEIQRAMQDLGLQDRPPFARYPGSRPLSHRSSIDYELHGPPVIFALRAAYAALSDAGY
ncbi:hypothetical protein G6F42_018681 [Rhizopus arrhizus]|nr:hypothetical protein G6F42_018681 [Rhizopus arrhizus]